MADLRYDQFSSGTPTPSRIILHADPATGALEKAPISDLNISSTPYSDINAKMRSLGSTWVAHAAGLNPCIYSNNLIATSARLVFTAIPTPAFYATGVYAQFGSSASFTATNFNGFALYSSSGGTLTRIAITANVGNSLGNSNAVTQYIAFTSTVALSDSLYWLAILHSNSAAPNPVQFRTSVQANAQNLNLFGTTNGESISAYIAGQTTPGTSYAWSALTKNINTVNWCGLY